MKDSDKGVVVFFTLFTVGIIITAFAYQIRLASIQEAEAPSGRRWGTEKGEHLNLFGLDQANYRVAVDCEITSPDEGNGTDLHCVNIGK